jgi:predicted Zn-dependent protease
MQLRLLPLVCRRTVAGAFGALSLVFAGCVSEPSAVTGERQAYGYSWQQELQLGEQSDQQITQEMGLYPDEEVQRYVDAVGRRVLEHSDLRNPDTPEIYRDTEFTFRVLDSPVVNAFALPGGYVYVTRGLLTHLQNEAQLAVVLGHEIAHVVARHASQQARRSQLSQLGLFAGAILGQQVLGGQGGDIASQIMNVGGQALQLLMFRYSREAERESDELGVRYGSLAGYETSHGAEFFRTIQRIGEKEGKAIPTWSSTHPDPGERRERIVELSRAARPPGSPPGEVNETQFLQRIQGMVMGENPREGFQRGDWFLHPELQFQFPVPPGWKLINERSMVAMVEPNRRGMIGFEIVPVATPREAAAMLAQQGQQQGLQVISANDVSINGMPATVVVGAAQTQQGQIGLQATFVQMGSRVYSFMGYAPAQVFSQARGVFDQVARGFSTLTDPAALQVQPARLRVETLDRDATFREIVPPVLPLGMTAEELAIINQVELNERLPAGRFVKMPR